MIRILAADDSPSIRGILESTLRDAGYDVSLAEDGVEALSAARASSYQVVLTDVNMPRMDGISLVRELRALPEYRYTPILVITTESSDDVRRRGREAGATGWLVKPFDPMRLLAVIGRVVG